MEQWSRPIIDNARRDFENLTDDFILNDEDSQSKRNEEFEGFIQGVKDRIDVESAADRQKYTAALAIKTFFEIYLPLGLALIILIWTLVLQFTSG